MSTMTAAPGRQHVLEGTGPVSERLGVTPGMLRSMARESGLYLQRGTGPMKWTAGLESDLVAWIATAYRPQSSRVDDDPFA